MKFSSIPGYTEIKSKLLDAVRNNHIAHAQLFLGKPGTANLPLALAYANYLHCQNKSEVDACGVCPACVKSLKFIHPDTSFVFPVGNLKADKDEERQKSEILKQWRSFLIEQPFGDLGDWMNFYGGEDKQALISRDESREIIKTLSLKPFESKYKVMIIWQPELMHPSAANGILKILEEPPANTFFILVSNSAEKLLPTILSRTQIVQIPYLADEDLSRFLSNYNPALSEEQRQQIIQLADGNMSLSIKLMETEDNHYQERFADWMRLCFKKDYTKLVSYADEFHDMDKLSQRNMFQYALSMFRETMLQMAGATTIARVKSGEAKFVQDFSKFLSIPKLESINELISSASYHLERNGSAKMIFLDLSLNISKQLRNN